MPRQSDMRFTFKAGGIEFDVVCAMPVPGAHS